MQQCNSFCAWGISSLKHSISLFFVSCIVGIGVGAAVSVVANFFVAAIAGMELFRETGILYQRPASFWRFVELMFWLGTGFVLVRGVAYFSQTEKWQGPADAIYTAHRVDAKLPIRQGIASIFAAFFSLGSGASLGQYGPIVQMGAVCGSIMRKLSPRYILSSDILIGCGVAAAISAAFQAPIAGIIFAHEAVLRHFSARAITPIAIASITAAFLGRGLFETVNLLQLEADSINLIMQLPFLLIGGLIFGFLAISVMASHLKLVSVIPQSGLAIWGVGSLAVLMLSALGWLVPDSLGIGMKAISTMLDGQMAGRELVILLGAKILAVLIASSCGFVGGFVSPALFMGAAAGGLFAFFLNGAGFEVSILVLMVAGMASVSATIVGAPIAMVMLVFELTESYDFAVAAMLSVVVASLLSHISYGHSLFDQQLKRRGISLSKGRGYIALSERNIASIVNPDFLRFTPDASVGEVRAAMVQHQITEAYCVAQNQHYKGKILLGALVDVDIQETVSRCVQQDTIILTEDMDLQQAMVIASDFLGETIAVLSSDKTYLKGVVSEGDLFAAYFETQQRIQKIEHG